MLALAAEANLRYSLQWETTAVASAQRCLRHLNFQQYLVNYPVHPGNAKQVMEPATLWFERRARRVQTCDKRQTLEPGQAQRAATIQRFSNNSLTSTILALSGQAVPQGAFAVSGE
jgi:hypothetical protein